MQATQADKQAALPR